MRDKAETRSWEPNTLISQRTTSINVRFVPIELRRRFAARCKLAGVSMQDRLQELIARDIDDYFQESDSEGS